MVIDLTDIPDLLSGKNGKKEVNTIKWDQKCRKIEAPAVATVNLAWN